MTQIIRTGRWSTTSLVASTDGSRILRKTLHHATHMQALREAAGAEAALGRGIPTPRFLGISRDTVSMKWHLDFVFLDIAPLVDLNLNARERLFSILRLLESSASRDARLATWSTYVSELASALNHANAECSWLSHKLGSPGSVLNWLSTQSEDCLVHGDFGLNNLARHQDEVVVYDFQSSCNGPCGWDRAYLIGSSFDPVTAKAVLGEPLWTRPNEPTFALIVAAVKLGRRLMRNQGVPEAMSLLRYWTDMVSTETIGNN